MNESITRTIREAEIKLDLQFPKKLFDFFRKLEKPEFNFKGEEWFFSSEDGSSKYDHGNFIIDQSEEFNKQWKRKALVLARNDNGDYLLCLQAKDRRVLKPIFILLTEKSQIRIYNYNLELLLEHGPVEYRSHEDYYLKLENGEVIEGEEWSEE